MRAYLIHVSLYLTNYIFTIWHTTSCYKIIIIKLYTFSRIFRQIRRRTNNIFFEILPIKRSLFFHTFLLSYYTYLIPRPPYSPNKLDDVKRELLKITNKIDIPINARRVYMSEHYQYLVASFLLGWFQHCCSLTPSSGTNSQFILISFERRGKKRAT